MVVDTHAIFLLLPVDFSSLLGLPPPSDSLLFGLCVNAVLLDDFCCIHSKFFSLGSFFHYGPSLLVCSNQSKVSASPETSFCLQLPTSYSCSNHQGHEPSGTKGILTASFASGYPFLWLISQSTLCSPTLKIYQSNLNTAQLHC